MKYQPTKKKKREFFSVMKHDDGIVIDHRDRKAGNINENSDNGNKSKRFFPFITGKFTLTFLIIGIILSLFAFLYSNSDDEVLLQDEKKKNDLLLSSQTDYSTEKDGPLVIRTHRVKRGETLSEIAKEYGVSMDTICGSSGLRSYDLIREGALLEIPNKDGIVFTMKKGSKLTKIAKKYRVSLKKILTQNRLDNPDFIPVGEKIFIPDARPQNLFPGFLWPVSSRKITCGYGWRRNPFNKRRRQFHHGLDIRSNYKRVRAAKYGKVTFSGWLGGYGKVIVLAHPGGWKTLYAHLSRIYVKKGQYVKQGQFVGKSGNTGRSTGPHLHVEIIKKGKHRNPYRYLKRR